MVQWHENDLTTSGGKDDISIPDAIKDTPDMEGGLGRRSPQLPKLPPPGGLNQAVGADPFYHEFGMRYRSRSEVYIARELEQRGILYLPNCGARITLPDGRRVTREPDFLIHYQGRWGIFEVDGATYHPASNACADHARDRLFRRYGIQVERYSAKVCQNQTRDVVADFLEMLSWRAS